ncbi:hypothetical protein CROQUDRAFT_97040 [Cronartium quercuum f. sp. fusiforme G11]|uniref:Uncharacterized protein n=1 Tax=Cronartium quercuum f. sp. fusiforme G11 TaxID=708437 RepID=A0A9P6NAB4_9BASI|nr:hypothetical protein CROQUDRAFT_97040 [Cronartium quercuum f. sp. fusiforme G11]
MHNPRPDFSTRVLDVIEDCETRGLNLARRLCLRAAIFVYLFLNALQQQSAAFPLKPHCSDCWRRGSPIGKSINYSDRSQGSPARLYPEDAVNIAVQVLYLIQRLDDAFLKNQDPPPHKLYYCSWTAGPAAALWIKDKRDTSVDPDSNPSPSLKTARLRTHL